MASLFSFAGALVSVVSLALSFDQAGSARTEASQAKKARNEAQEALAQAKDANKTAVSAQGIGTNAQTLARTAGDRAEEAHKGAATALQKAQEAERGALAAVEEAKNNAFLASKAYKATLDYCEADVRLFLLDHIQEHARVNGRERTDSEAEVVLNQYLKYDTVSPPETPSFWNTYSGAVERLRLIINERSKSQ
jgi:hypothetical protein